MAQGKMKVKSKLPANTKVKKNKGNAVTKRSNAPVPKKVKDQMKAAVSKIVNKKVENEIRSMAVEKEKNLSKAQQAVVKHNLKMKT